MIFPIKPEDKMLQEMLDDLVESTGINDLSVGAVARSILEVFNRQLHEAHVYLDINASLIFLSSSQGPYLDLIGYMLSCQRDGDEDDDNYRYRISQQVFAAATANETAIRLRCLSVAEVKDVILTKYTRGSGSFSVHVITDELHTPDNVIQEVEDAVRYNKAEGIRVIVEKPKIIPIDMQLSVQRLNKNMSISIESLERELKEYIQDYVDDMGMGSKLSIQKLISLALERNELSQVLLTSLKIDNEQIIVREFYEMEWNERAHIRDISIKIME